MIQVQAPNGDIVQFPDGTADDVMASAMRKKYGKPADSGNWDIPSEAVDMLTFGLAKKGAAAARGAIDTLVDGGTYGENYDRQLAKLRGQQDAYGEAHPYRKKVGQGLGIAVGAAKLPAATPFSTSTTLGRVGNAAATGGAYGTVAGAAEDANSFYDRAVNAAKGAGFGTLFGAGAYPVAVAGGKVLNKSYQYIRDFFTKQNNLAGSDKVALTGVLEELQAAGVTPQEAWQKLQKLGPEATLADVAPNIAAKTSREALKTPEAVSMVTTRFGDRLKGGHARMENALDTAFGPKVDPYSVKQAARAAQATTGNVYKSAAGYEVDTAPVADFVQKEILKVGPRGPWGSSLQQIRSLIVDDAGNLISNGERVHAIREQLDIMAESARNSGQGKLASKIGDVRKLVDKSLKEGVPGFAEADAKFAGEARKVERFEQGRRAALTNKMTPEEIASIVDNPDVPMVEKQMLAQGSRWNIAEGMSNSRNNPGFAVDRITTRNMNQPKIEKLTGSPRAAQGLADAIERENTFTETANMAMPNRNSATAMRTAQKSGPENPSILQDMAYGAMIGAPGGLTGTATGAGGGLLRNIAVRVKNALGERVNAKVVNSTVDMLSTMDANKQAFILNSIESQLSRAGKSKITEATLSRMIRAALIQYGSREAPNVPVPRLLAR